MCHLEKKANETFFRKASISSEFSPSSTTSPTLSHNRNDGTLFIARIFKRSAVAVPNNSLTKL